MIIKLKVKSIDWEQQDLMEKAGIPEQAEQKSTLMAVDTDLIEWLIGDPDKDNVCYFMYYNMPGQTTVYQSFEEVFKLWKDGNEKPTL